MRWKDYVDEQVHANIAACEKIRGKPLTQAEAYQVRLFVESIMKHVRKANFRKLAEKKNGARPGSRP